MATTNAVEVTMIFEGSGEGEVAVTMGGVTDSEMGCDFCDQTAGAAAGTVMDLNSGSAMACCASCLNGILPGLGKVVRVES